MCQEKEHTAIKLNSVNSRILFPPLPGMGFDKMEVIAIGPALINPPSESQENQSEKEEKAALQTLSSISGTE